MAESRTRTSREEWAKRVERWQDSGLTAAEFARELGINASTLAYWKYALKKGAESSTKRRTKRSRRQPRPALAPQPSFVEVEASTPTNDRFELELSRGRRLRIPRGFDEATLRRLVGVLEAT